MKAEKGSKELLPLSSGGSFMNRQITNDHVDTNRRRRLTSPWQRVFWGYTWQVQGHTGSNSAQPSHPRGSTLTFQLTAGVSWALGLRHGVTMHPRGRHLRGDRIPLPHGKDSALEREQQPPHQLWHDSWRRKESIWARHIVFVMNPVLFLAGPSL